LVEYDFNFPKRISKEKVLQLFDCDFIKRHGCAVLLGPTGTGKSQPMNTPLVTQECEGQVTVTDPCHPLYGRTFTLSGLAVLPGHVRHCQVEILPGQVAYIPVAATNLSTEPRPQPAVLTASAVEELVAAFQAVGGRRHNHATRPKPACLDAPGPRRTNRRHHGDRQGSHAGRGT